MIEKTYTVTGMHCESCVALISEEVAEVAGVESVDVDLASGRARVRLDPAVASDGAIVDAVRNAGYDAAPSS